MNEEQRYFDATTAMGCLGDTLLFGYDAGQGAGWQLARVNLTETGAVAAPLFTLGRGKTEPH